VKAVLAQPKWPLIWQSDTVRAPRNVKKVAPLGCAVEAASGHRGKKVIIAGDCPHKYRAAPLLLNRPRFSTLDQQGPHPTTSQEIEGAIVRASISGWRQQHYDTRRCISTISLLDPCATDVHGEGHGLSDLLRVTARHLIRRALQQLHRDEHQHGIVVPDQLLHRVTPRGSWIGFNRSHCAVSMPWSDGAFSPRKRTIRPGFQDWPRRRHLSRASRPTSSGQWRSVEKRFASASVQKRLQKIHFRSGPIQSWVHSIANAFHRAVLF